MLGRNSKKAAAVAEVVATQIDPGFLAVLISLHEALLAALHGSDSIKKYQTIWNEFQSVLRIAPREYNQTELDNLCNKLAAIKARLLTADGITERKFKLFGVVFDAYIELVKQQWFLQHPDTLIFPPSLLAQSDFEHLNAFLEKIDGYFSRMEETLKAGLDVNEVNSSVIKNFMRKKKSTLEKQILDKHHSAIINNSPIAMEVMMMHRHVLNLQSEIENHANLVDERAERVVQQISQLNMAVLQTQFTEIVKEFKELINQQQYFTSQVDATQTTWELIKSQLQSKPLINNIVNNTDGADISSDIAMSLQCEYQKLNEAYLAILQLRLAPESSPEACLLTKAKNTVDELEREVTNSNADLQQNLVESIKEDMNGRHRVITKLLATAILQCHEQSAKSKIEPKWDAFKQKLNQYLEQSKETLENTKNILTSSERINDLTVDSYNLFRRSINTVRDRIANFERNIFDFCDGQLEIVAELREFENSLKNASQSYTIENFDNQLFWQKLRDRLEQVLTILVPPNNPSYFVTASQIVVLPASAVLKAGKAVVGAALTVGSGALSLASGAVNVVGKVGSGLGSAVVSAGATVVGAGDVVISNTVGLFAKPKRKPDSPEKHYIIPHIQVKNDIESLLEKLEMLQSCQQAQQNITPENMKSVWFSIRALRAALVSLDGDEIERAYKAVPGRNEDELSNLFSGEVAAILRTLQAVKPEELENLRQDQALQAMLARLNMLNTFFTEQASVNHSPGIRQ